MKFNFTSDFRPNKKQLLGALKLTEDLFGRFRSIYIEGEYIVVHTRCGGGNREYFQTVFEITSNHDWFSHEEDCDYDNTYADFFFEIPDICVSIFNELCKEGKALEEVWTEVFLKDIK